MSTIYIDSYQVDTDNERIYFNLSGSVSSNNHLITIQTTGSGGSYVDPSSYRGYWFNIYEAGGVSISYDQLGVSAGWSGTVYVSVRQGPTTSDYTVIDWASISVSIPDDSSSSGGGSSGGNEDEEEEETYEWYKTTKSTIVKKSTSGNASIGAYEIYGIKINAEQNCTVEIYTQENKSDHDVDALYNIGSTSSTCEVTYYINSYGNVNSSGNTGHNSSTANSFTDTFELEKGDYLEYAWFNYNRVSTSYYYEITIKPIITDYTVTYNLGTGKEWTVKTSGLTQTKKSNADLTLFTASELFAVKDAEKSTGKKITFNANGGTFTTSTTYVNSVKTTTYTHAGWSKTSGSSNIHYAFGAPYTSNAAITLYPCLQKTESYSDIKTFDATQCERPSYQLLGWSTDSKASTATYTPGGDAPGNTATTLYAVWKLNTCTVTIPDTANVSTTGTGTYTIGDTVTITATPADGYRFVKWTYLDSDFSTNATHNFTMPSNDLTLIPVVEPIEYTYTIQYCSTTGKKLKEEPFTQDYDTQRTIEIPAIDGYNRSRTNHTIYWSDAQDKTIKIAPYEPIEYRITINFNNQQEPPTIENYTIEQSFSFDTIPIYPDNAFIGWSGSDITSLQRNIYIPIDTIGDKTYEANWQPFTVFHFTNYNNISETAPKLLKDLANPTGIAIHWYAPKGLMEQFIALINNNCNTTLVLNEKQTLNDYNVIVKTLNKSPEPAHYSGSIRPELMNKTADDFITVDDLLALENAFNNRKFIK